MQYKSQVKKTQHIRHNIPAYKTELQNEREGTENKSCQNIKEMVYYKSNYFIYFIKFL